MTACASYQSYDHLPITVIPVIASFDTDGHIKPLYVRIDGLALKVHSCWLKPSFSGVMEFNCKIIDHDCLKPLVLSFHQTEGVWTIPSILAHASDGP